MSEDPTSHTERSEERDRLPRKLNLSVNERKSIRWKLMIYRRQICPASTCESNHDICSVIASVGGWPLSMESRCPITPKFWSFLGGLQAGNWRALHKAAWMLVQCAPHSRLPARKLRGKITVYSQLHTLLHFVDALDESLHQTLRRIHCCARWAARQWHWRVQHNPEFCSANHACMLLWERDSGSNSATFCQHQRRSSALPSDCNGSWVVTWCPQRNTHEILSADPPTHCRTTKTGDCFALLRTGEFWWNCVSPVLVSFVWSFISIGPFTTLARPDG